MTSKFADRAVQYVECAGGTSAPYTYGAAFPGPYRAVAGAPGISDDDPVLYSVEETGGSRWEVALGVYDSVTGVTRGTLLASSTGAAVDWSGTETLVLVLGPTAAFFQSLADILQHISDSSEVPGLNAQMVGGVQASFLALVSDVVSKANGGTFDDTVSFAAGLGSGGDPPFVVSGQSQVDNLNVEFLRGLGPAAFATAGHDHSGVYSAVGHTHAHADLTGLTSGDPHTQYLPVSGSRAMANPLDMASFAINSLGAPSASTDAANKGYVDAAVPKLLHLEDRRTSGTAGGGFTAGGWVKRTLSAVENNISGASVSSSVVTLPAGTYRAEWSCPAYLVDKHQTRLQNTSDSALVSAGAAEFAYSTIFTQNRSTGHALFTLAGSKNLELQHWCVTTRATDGLGAPGSLAGGELYSWLKIWKVA